MTLSKSFDSFLPTTLGFDRVFDILDHVSNQVNSSNGAFPPVNVVKVDDNNYLIEVAIAGYKKDEIEVLVEKNLLIINGKKLDKDERQYIVKGIAGRQFQRKFVLSDTIEVGASSLSDGVLTVSLENVIPEAQKPRKIEIL